jgi:hypothetical protein
MPQVQLRRIQLKATDEQGQRQVFTIAPCDILPYMTGHVTEVEKALFLRRFGVPFWALTYVFGRNDSYWFNLTMALGRHDIVGTTVKQSENLPRHLLADLIPDMKGEGGNKCPTDEQAGSRRLSPAR